MNVAIVMRSTFSSYEICHVLIYVSIVIFGNGELFGPVYLGRICEPRGIRPVALELEP